MAKEFQLKPLEDRIVVKPSEEEQTTVSGIVIPDTAKEKPQEGSVVAVGPGRFEDGAREPSSEASDDYFLMTASTSRADRIRYSSPSTLTSVPPYLE